MRLIVRYVRSRSSGRETRDVVFDGDRATIGRGTDQSIQIQDHRLPLQHSALRLKGGKLELRTEGAFDFTLNGQLLKRAELNPGDLVDIFGHEFRVVEGDSDDDLIVEVEIETETVDPLRSRFKTRLWELELPQRKLSWILFVLVLLVGIIIPGVGIFVGMQPLRESPLPDDSLWLAGALHPTHAFMADDCNYCHTLPFVPARDEDCLACHLSVNHHFDTKFHGRDYKIGSDCQDCHVEHSGPNAIIRTDQAVCTVCHADLAAVDLESDRLENASDFLIDHPSFRVTVAAWLEGEDGKQGQWQTRRQELWDDELMEQSNLIFPHDIHVSDEGIMGPSGVQELVCTSCHEAEKGGLRMKTVTMEKHCASCHQLTFDPATPDRVVPHGDPVELMRTLREYYAWQYLELQSQAEGRTVAPVAESQTRPARRPGRRQRQLITSLIPDQPAPNRSAEANAYIDRHVSEAANNLFERQTCTICHTIERDEAAEVPYKVLPVHLMVDWMPLAEFSHDSHKNMQCLGCHEADFSAEATEVLMPDIGSCRTCHGGEDAENRLQSDCVTCHKFHLESQGPMGALVALDEDGNMVDADGNLIDAEGNLIDEDGNLIDVEGYLIDADGNRIHAEGIDDLPDDLRDDAPDKQNEDVDGTP